MFQNEIDNLPESNCLIKEADWQVYYAHANQIPSILLEIGQLREKAFSNIKHQTNQLDLDNYDSDYIHVFVYNIKTQHIVSACRLGQSDTILANKGLKGLYTSSLFEFPDTFFDKLGPSLEFGRTFVREEYQRKYAPLLQLFRGICRYIVLHPKYRFLFGLISIGQQYHSRSHELIVSFFENSVGYSNLARDITASYPFVFKDNLSNELDYIEIVELNRLIKKQEQGQRSLPILIKEYLKFNTSLLSFGRDPLFDNCLDLLCIADLATSEPAILERYMGNGVNHYLSTHPIRN